MQFTLKQMFIAVVLFSLAMWIIVDFTRVEQGVDVPSVNWLPKTATNVSYYKAYVYTAYEYDISEAEFLKWSKSDCKPIVSHQSVRRCSSSTSKLPSLPDNPTEAQRNALEYASIDNKVAVVFDGLFYEHQLSNGGGVTIVYDREHGRAYFYSSKR